MDDISTSTTNKRKTKMIEEITIATRDKIGVIHQDEMWFDFEKNEYPEEPIYRVELYDRDEYDKTATAGGDFNPEPYDFESGFRTVQEAIDSCISQINA